MTLLMSHSKAILCCVSDYRSLLNFRQRLMQDEGEFSLMWGMNLKGAVAKSCWVSSTEKFSHATFASTPMLHNQEKKNL